MEMRVDVDDDRQRDNTGRSGSEPRAARSAGVDNGMVRDILAAPTAGGGAGNDIGDNEGTTGGVPGATARRDPDSRGHRRRTGGNGRTFRGGECAGRNDRGIRAREPPVNGQRGGARTRSAGAEEGGRHTEGARSA
jgi:hypothetical protein